MKNKLILILGLVVLLTSMDFQKNVFAGFQNGNIYEAPDSGGITDTLTIDGKLKTCSCTVQGGVTCTDCEQVYCTEIFSGYSPACRVGGHSLCCSENGTGSDCNQSFTCKLPQPSAPSLPLSTSGTAPPSTSAPSLP
ncbi:MAG: hypothetical protein A3B68_02630 [Candidatus Melainabacteria bacterium RIFCSPHIGHO2_02_FULL_34_12]|nr:MAG: hypothetical protein A3B68_02630 [Candidatus Melainabacteria bacterium RIFCSPHIGHO2_02_FULL_34_12]